MKVATQLSSDLMEVKYEEVNPESLLLNELLIDELKNTLADGESYISRDDVEKLEEYKALINELELVYRATDTTSLTELKDKVSKLTNLNNIHRNNLTKSQMLVDRKAQYVERLKAKIERQDKTIKKKHDLVLKLKEEKKNLQAKNKKLNYILKSILTANVLDYLRRKW